MKEEENLSGSLLWLWETVFCDMSKACCTGYVKRCEKERKKTKSDEKLWALYPTVLYKLFC